MQKAATLLISVIAVTQLLYSLHTAEPASTAQAPHPHPTQHDAHPAQLPIAIRTTTTHTLPTASLSVVEDNSTVLYSEALAWKVHEGGPAFSASGTPRSVSGLPQRGEAVGWVSSYSTAAQTCDKEKACYATLHNVCYSGGKLEVAAQPRHAVQVSLCNEVDKQLNVPLTVHRSGPESPYKVASEPLFLLFCWEYTGYHLMYCLSAVWSRLFSEALVQNGGVLQEAEKTAAERMRAARYWALTSPKARTEIGPQILVGFAALLGEVSRYGGHKGGLCFHTVYAGFPKPNTISPLAMRTFMRHAKQQLQVDMKHLQNTLSTSLRSYILQVLIVERKGNYHIQNLRDVETSVKGFFARRQEALTTTPSSHRRTAELVEFCRNRMEIVSANISVARFEELSLLSQLQNVAGAQVFVGTHGNALTWVLFMQTGTFMLSEDTFAHRPTLIELWPGGSYNGNYNKLAKSVGVHHIGIENGARHERFDYTVNTVLLRGAVATAAMRLQEQAIPDTPYVKPLEYSPYDDIHRNVVKKSRNLYLSLGISKTRGNHAGQAIGMGSWPAVLNKAYYHLGTSYNSTPAEAERCRETCVEGKGMQREARTLCIIAYDVLRYAQTAGVTLAPAEWVVPEMQDTESQKRIHDTTANDLFQKELALRKAGQWNDSDPYVLEYMIAPG